MKWLVLTQTVTSKGNPREFTTYEHVYSTNLTKVHLIAAERTAGPDDSSGIPRRVVGMGTDRASARRSLEAIIKRYDPSHDIVFAR